VITLLQARTINVLARGQQMTTREVSEALGKDRRRTLGVLQGLYARRSVARSEAFGPSGQPTFIWELRR
jgi:predicted transcriptional regulator